MAKINIDIETNLDVGDCVLFLDKDNRPNVGIVVDILAEQIVEHGCHGVRFKYDVLSYDKKNNYELSVVYNVDSIIDPNLVSLLYDEYETMKANNFFAVPNPNSVIYNNKE